MRFRGLSVTFLAVVLTLYGCGSEGSDRSDDPVAEASGPSVDAPAAEGGALSRVELEQGIGPIRDLELPHLDSSLVEEGQEAFVLKCSACHKVEERYIGPELGTVLSRRRPEFVMNMILNANEMVQRHPDVRKMLAEYYTPMPVQVTDSDEARAILEYLRSAQAAPG